MATSAPPAVASGTRTGIFLAAIVLVTLVVRVPTFRLPLDQDSAVYTCCAMTWAEGGLPYRDAWDHKPPLIYGVYRLTFAAAPPSQVPVNTSLRVGSALCDAGTAVLLFLLAGRLFGQGAGAAAGLLFAAVSGAALLSMEAFQPERLVALLSVAAILAAMAYTDSRRQRYAALCGLLFGLAFIAKQIAAPVGVAVWLWLTWDAFRAEGRAALKRVVVHSALMAAGALLPWALCMAYFAAHGAFRDFWECTYTYNALYASEFRKGVLGTAARELAKRAFDHGFLWLAGAGGLALALARRTERRAGVLLALWAASAFVALVLPGQFAGYYYLPTVAPLAVLAGVALVGLWRVGCSPRSLPLRIAVVAPCVLVLLAFAGLAAKRSYGSLQLKMQPKQTDNAVAAAARYIAAKTTPDDRIYVWGSRPQIYVLSGRRNVCRYLYNFYYHLPKERAFPFQQARLNEIMDGLRKYRPVYIVVTDPVTFAYFPELKKHLDEGYALERTFEAVEYPPMLYRRKDAS